MFPIKQVRSLDLLDGTTESPPEIPHKSRRRLMSPQECEIARCSPNQLEMMTNPPALASEQCPIPKHTGRLTWLTSRNSRHSLSHPSQVYRNTNFSLGNRGNLHALHIGVPIDLRRVSEGISGVAQRKPSQSSCMIWNGALL